MPSHRTEWDWVPHVSPLLRDMGMAGCPTLPAFCAGGWDFTTCPSCLAQNARQGWGNPVRCGSGQKQVSRLRRIAPIPGNPASQVAPPFPRFLREGGISPCPSCLAQNTRQGWGNRRLFAGEGARATLTASAARFPFAPGTFLSDPRSWFRRLRRTGRTESGRGPHWRRSAPAAALCWRFPA